MAPKIDIDALLAENERRPAGGTCSVRLALDAMDATTRPKFQAALDDLARFSHGGLANAFVGVGFDIGENAVQRHRKGRCKCPR